MPFPFGARIAEETDVSRPRGCHVKVPVEPAPRVIVLHGLWMHAPALAPLIRRLRAAGFAAETFGYRSMTGGPHAALESLRTRIERTSSGAGAPDVPLHLVGHSLGGLIALEAARAINLEDSGTGSTGSGRSVVARVGRVVCLGSPLRGSLVAGAIAKSRGTGWLLGHSAGLLQRGVDDWCGACEVGVIAGSVPVGLGSLLGGLERPHDGTVTVGETRLAGVSAHCVVPASHTGLLFSERAVEQCVRFLREGRFA